MTSDKISTILFLCTGNSCRSQMAEGWLNRLAPDRFRAVSAGTHPAPEVHPLAVRVMSKVGINLASHRPKRLEEAWADDSVDTIISVCDSAAASCPVPPAGTERLHWPFEDPAVFVGRKTETLEKFREVRDLIGEALRQRLVEKDAPFDTIR